MGVEDLNEHKRRKRLRSSKAKNDWLSSVYNPKSFRRKRSQASGEQGQGPNNFKLTAYIATMTVAILLILAVAVLKKHGLIE